MKSEFFGNLWHDVESYSRSAHSKPRHFDRVNLASTNRHKCKNARERRINHYYSLFFIHVRSRYWYFRMLLTPAHYNTLYKVFQLLTRISLHIVPRNINLTLYTNPFPTRFFSFLSYSTVFFSSFLFACWHSKTAPPNLWSFYAYNFETASISGFLSVFFIVKCFYFNFIFYTHARFCTLGQCRP